MFYPINISIRVERGSSFCVSQDQEAFDEFPPAVQIRGRQASFPSKPRSTFLKVTIPDAVRFEFPHVSEYAKCAVSQFLWHRKR